MKNFGILCTGDAQHSDDDIWFILLFFSGRQQQQTDAFLNVKAVLCARVFTKKVGRRQAAAPFEKST